MAHHKNEFRSLFQATLDLLESLDVEYVIIGGIATDVWALPRKTNDVDVLIRLAKSDHLAIFDRATEFGFSVDRRKCVRQIRRMGMFRVRYGKLHTDFIIGDSEFEEDVFRRRRLATIFERKCYVASPEDVVLYKIFASREIDLADIRRIITTQGKRLDVCYLRARALRMQHDLNRADIVATLERYLRAGGLV